MRPSDDLPGPAIVVAIMLAAVALMTIPVTLACIHIAHKLPALRAILSAQGG